MKGFFAGEHPTRSRSLAESQPEQMSPFKGNSSFSISPIREKFCSILLQFTLSCSSSQNFPGCGVKRATHSETDSDPLDRPVPSLDILASYIYPVTSSHPISSPFSAQHWVDMSAAPQVRRSLMWKQRNNMGAACCSFYDSLGSKEAKRFVSNLKCIITTSLSAW